MRIVPKGSIYRNIKLIERNHSLGAIQTNELLVHGSDVNQKNQNGTYMPIPAALEVCIWPSSQLTDYCSTPHRAAYGKKRSKKEQNLFRDLHKHEPLLQG